MNRLFLGIACVALLAVSVHAGTRAQVAPASWSVAQPQTIQTVSAHTMVGGFHTIRAGF